jgi:hypothetical protein
VTLDARAAAAAYIAAGYPVILAKPFQRAGGTGMAATGERADGGTCKTLQSQPQSRRATSEASGGIVDFDLDSPKACGLASALLPATAEFGRASKPANHRFYRATEGHFQSRRFHDPEDNALLFETRGDGCQTLVPPSMHPSKERIEWSSSTEPARISTAHVEFLAGRLAAACVVLRAWTPGRARSVGHGPLRLPASHRAR